ncbi:hypothetical protein PGT21_030116 [Puccinia graminis f. sp. tritici]|uniref:Uncharacterized protein n=1 Tax=Puccinia graminis f. sp. tritici TaxID=56615 RepID=A0A5B0LXN6_PUCGR|nr:hypothetical protein PGT21_030116 [Puccinia graminis f. sp. tritici]
MSCEESEKKAPIRPLKPRISLACPEGITPNDLDRKLLVCPLSLFKLLNLQTTVPKKASLYQPEQMGDSQPDDLQLLCFRLFTA